MLRTETIRNLKTAWLESGPENSDRIFLFLHGCPDSPEIWDSQIQHFSKNSLVLAPYLRGVGPSESPRKRGGDNRYSLDSIALDHLEILRKYDPNGKRKVVVVGHDIGAPYA